MSDCSIVVQNVMTYEGNHSGNETHDGHTLKLEGARESAYLRQVNF